MKAAVGALNRFKDFEETDDSLNLCRIVFSFLLLIGLAATFMLNFAYYLSNPHIYIDTLNEEPTLDNIADYNCDCTNQIQNYADFITVNGNMDDMCPTPPYTSVGYPYYDLLICQISVQTFAQLLVSGSSASVQYLNSTKLIASIFNDWKRTSFNIWASLGTTNQFQYTIMKNFYWLQRDYPSEITNGFSQSQWDDVVYPWLIGRREPEIAQQLATTLGFIAVNTDPNIPNLFSVNVENYFTACGPTNCQRTLVYSTSDQLLDSLSFAGGLLPLFTVILTIFYAITAKCCRGVLTCCYRSLRDKPSSGSDIQLKVPDLV